MKDKTEEIRRLASIKSQTTVDKALNAIDELLKNGSKITFYNVYTKAGISKSFVYNNEEIRGIIERYRDGQGEPTRKTNSKDTIIQIQKQRIKELERMLEGVNDVSDKFEKLRAENMELKKQLRKAYEY